MTLIDNMSDMVDREDTSGMHGSLHHLQPGYITVDQMLGLSVGGRKTPLDRKSFLSLV